MPQQEPETYLQLVLDSVSEGVFTIAPDTRVTSLNRAAELVLGVSREEAVGKPCCDLLGTHECRNACAFRQAMEAGAAFTSRDTTVASRERGRVPVRITMTPLRDAGGAVIGGVGTFTETPAASTLRREAASRETVELAGIRTRNSEMGRLLSLLPDVGASTSTVLIEGPSGSGKEVVARAIHALGPRRDAPFVAVNCSALPEALLESELFGYVRGAFTGATRDHPGRLAAANGGTLFLDEVGDIALPIQVKLLRVLQDHVYEPVGAAESIQADVRIVAATHRNLKGLVAAGRFREDLFFRLNVVRLQLPPLAERLDDVPLLVHQFIAAENQRQGRRVMGISPEALDLLLAYAWPGNIRELQNAIQHAFVLCRGPHLQPDHFPAEIREVAERQAPEAANLGPLEQSELDAIRLALKRNEGNRKETAKELGIHPATLWRKMRRFGLS